MRTLVSREDKFARVILGDLENSQMVGDNLKVHKKPSLQEVTLNHLVHGFHEHGKVFEASLLFLGRIPGLRTMGLFG